MKINAEIIFEGLKKRYPVEIRGPQSKKMLLSYPEFYIDEETTFKENHLYLCTVEHLPQRPILEKNVVIVSIGENLRLNYYKEHATVIVIKKKVDFFQVYKDVQAIFDELNLWESKLLATFVQSSTVQDVIDCSYPVFLKNIMVLNASLQLVASSESTTQKNANFENLSSSLDPAALSEYMSDEELVLDAHGAISLSLRGTTFVCVNLFDTNENYMGCLVLDYGDETPMEGELRLAEHLALMIEKTIERNPLLISDDHSYLKEVLQNMMYEMPLSSNQRMFLKSVNKSESYYCISVHCLQQLSSLPVSYMCSVCEGIFKDSVFFEQNNTILGLIPSTSIKDRDDIETSIKSQLDILLKDTLLCIGVSNEMHDLYMIRTYYTQAEAAIENGFMCCPSNTVFLFCDYALMEMISNSLGGMPVETYFPSGFKELIEHDKEGGVSYIETLSTFLDENMSYSKTARLLFIHRSTLVERIERIESELDINLSNPDHRLQVQMLLKSLNIEELVKNRKE